MSTRPPEERPSAPHTPGDAKVDQTGKQSPRSEFSTIQQLLRIAELEKMAAACEFAASISHDVRNSLAGMQMGLTNLAAESTDPEFSSRVDEIVSEIVRLGRRLGNVVNMTRPNLEGGTLFDADSWLTELLELVRLQIPPEIQLEAHVQAGIQLNLPKDRLGLTLRNILLNSVDAIGNRKGQIRIRIARNEDKIEISVEDDGPGFSEEILTQGIRLLSHSDADKARLGLAIARRYVRDIGGKIQLSNLQGDPGTSGARVVLLLP